MNIQNQHLKYILTNIEYSNYFDNQHGGSMSTKKKQLQNKFIKTI